MGENSDRSILFQVKIVQLCKCKAYPDADLKAMQTPASEHLYEFARAPQTIPWNGWLKQ
jgi:hypothetical protein